MLTALLFIFAATLATLNLMGHIAISWWWIVLIFPGIQIIIITIVCLVGYLFVSRVKRNDPQRILDKYGSRSRFGR